MRGIINLFKELLAGKQLIANAIRLQRYGNNMFKHPSCHSQQSALH